MGIDELRAENAELKAENAELKRRLDEIERMLRRNSANCNRPAAVVVTGA